MKKFTSNVFTSNTEFCEGDTFQSLTKLILENNIDVICTSGLSRDYLKVKEIIDIARQIKPGIITVIGGGIISGDPEPAMIALNAEIGVFGEGEITICELAHAFDNNLSLANIPGLIYRNGQDGFIINSQRPETNNIDTLPLPDHDGFSYPEYVKSINYETAYVIASRSCLYSCTFCFHPSGKKYSQRSLVNLFAEIDFLVKTSAVKSLVISDELFAVKKERVYEFCRRILPYNIIWSLQLRVTDVDVEMLQTMRRSGCVCISYGLESANNTVLKSMKRHITIEQIEYALKITYDMNIDVQRGFIFGDTAATKGTAANTVKWHDDNSHYELELNMIQVFPGTPLYNYAFENGIIKDKVEYLMEGCPIINVSKLTDAEYKNLSSLFYEKNMRPKYQPQNFTIKNVNSNGECNVDMGCNKCGAKNSFTTNILHVVRMHCPQCSQRHYVDPFKKIECSQEVLGQYFSNNGTVALWGAGEISIKLLDNYDIFKNNNFKVVDISKSRQGYSIVGKSIYSPDINKALNIKTIVVTVVKRKEEIIHQINTRFPSVTNIYFPDIEKTDEDISFILRKIDRNRTVIQNVKKIKEKSKSLV